MKKIKYIIIISFFTFATSQSWTPFHYQDLQNHGNVYVDFESIDQIARQQTLIPKNRETLTHEIIGYLPYWEYSHYPNLDFNLLTQINYFSAELDAYGNIINNLN